MDGQQNNDTPLTVPLASVGCACTLKEANPASRQAKQPAGGGKDSSGGLLYKMQISPRCSRFHLIFLIHSGWWGDAEPLKDTLFPRTTRNRRLCHYVFFFFAFCKREGCLHSVNGRSPNWRLPSRTVGSCLLSNSEIKGKNFQEMAILTIKHNYRAECFSTNCKGVWIKCSVSRNSSKVPVVEWFCKNFSTSFFVFASIHSPIRLQHAE